MLVIADFARGSRGLVAGLQQVRIDLIGGFERHFAIRVVALTAPRRAHRRETGGSTGEVGWRSMVGHGSRGLIAVGHGRSAIARMVEHRGMVGGRSATPIGGVDRSGTAAGQPFLAMPHVEAGGADHVLAVEHPVPRAEIHVRDPDAAHIAEVDVEPHARSLT